MRIFLFAFVLFNDVGMDSVKRDRAGDYYSDRIVAVVDRKPIFLSFVRSFSEEFGMDLTSALETIIDLHVIHIFAGKMNIPVFEDEVNQHLEKFISDTFSEDEKRFIIKGKILGDKIFFKIAGYNVITEEDLKKFYTLKQQEIKKYLERRFVLYYEFEKDIEDIEIEEDITKFKELGWIRRGEMKEIFEREIFSTKGFTRPIKIGEKIIIFYVKDVYFPSFEEIKDSQELREIYIKENMKEVFQKWVEERKKELLIERRNLL